MNAHPPAIVLSPCLENLGRTLRERELACARDLDAPFGRANVLRWRIDALRVRVAEAVTR